MTNLIRGSTGMRARLHAPGQYASAGAPICCGDDADIIAMSLGSIPGGPFHQS